MRSSVAIFRCPDYDPERVFQAVHSALEAIGGIQKYVRPGAKVLLKPNMLSAKEPERAITTHPVFIEAMIREVRAAGGEVWIGDSPSGALKGVKRCWEKTGFFALAERTGVELVSFEAGGTVVKKVNEHTFHIAKAVFDADLVINLPKFKTHGFALYTGAVKNLFGTLPGFQKASFHKMFTHPARFGQVLAEIYGLVKPGLHVMDGILGMEGNGPATGHPRQTGLVLASADGVALDTVASAIMGFKKNEIDAVRIAGESGFGVHRLDDIDILGERLEDVRFNDFALPSNHLMKYVPDFLVRWLGSFVWVRPKADERCTGCAICARGCPVEAICMQDGRPVVDYKRCINCLCCNESCPESAMIQELSWLARRVG
jgi:uncharacterized protein (DUF362 family)/Pyruvate/2-oxoacid:ferredoxin oxidoreductase delta subunit